jgi:hypothetical protein
MNIGKPFCWTDWYLSPNTNIRYCFYHKPEQSVPTSLRNLFMHVHYQITFSLRACAHCKQISYCFGAKLHVYYISIICITSAWFFMWQCWILLRETIINHNSHNKLIKTWTKHCLGIKHMHWTGMQRQEHRTAPLNTSQSKLNRSIWSPADCVVEVKIFVRFLIGIQFCHICLWNCNGQLCVWKSKIWDPVIIKIQDLNRHQWKIMLYSLASLPTLFHTFCECKWCLNKLSHSCSFHILK